MLKHAFIVAAGALAVAVLATAATGPAATAASPKCKLPGTNKVVACTDKLKSDTPRKPYQLEKGFISNYQISKPPPKGRRSAK